MSSYTRHALWRAFVATLLAALGSAGAAADELDDARAERDSLAASLASVLLEESEQRTVAREAKEKRAAIVKDMPSWAKLSIQNLQDRRRDALRALVEITQDFVPELVSKRPRSAGAMMEALAIAAQSQGKHASPAVTLRVDAVLANSFRRFGDEQRHLAFAERVRAGAAPGDMGEDTVRAAIVSLASLRGKQGRLEEALAIEREFDQLLLAGAGRKHDIRLALERRAVLLEKLGDIAGLEEIARRRAGIEDSQTTPSQIAEDSLRIARVSRSGGDLARALEQYAQALEQLESADVGDRSGQVILARAELVQVLHDLGRAQDAVTHERRLVELIEFERACQGSCKRVELVPVLIRAKRFPEAERLLADQRVRLAVFAGMKGFDEIRKTAAPETTEERERLPKLYIELYRAWGRPDDAASYERVLTGASEDDE